MKKIQKVVYELPKKFSGTNTTARTKTATTQLLLGNMTNLPINNGLIKLETFVRKKSLPSVAQQTTPVTLTTTSNRQTTRSVTTPVLQERKENIERMTNPA